MQGSRASTYGDSVADIYDELLSLDDVETAQSVEFLAQLLTIRGGPALELGVGTGRVALELAARGHRVHGVDASRRMLEKLRAKPGGDAIVTTHCDFSDLRVLARTFPVAFIVFNTIFALTTSEAQVACFASVARQLDRGGCFVVQASVPDPARIAERQHIDVRSVEVDRVRINIARYNIAEQSIAMTHLIIDERGTHLYPVPMRYAYPSELDLMAQLAGLRLRERYATWRRDEFRSDSRQHISIYEPM